MIKLNEVFQTAKDAYETIGKYYNETCDIGNSFIDFKHDFELMMFLDKNVDYSSEIEECKESIALLHKIAGVLSPIVDQLEEVCEKLVENQELLWRGETHGQELNERHNQQN